MYIPEGGLVQTDHLRIGTSLPPGISDQINTRIRKTFPCLYLELFRLFGPSEVSLQVLRGKFCRVLVKNKTRVDDIPDHYRGPQCSQNAEIPKDTNTKADPIETPPHPDMALVALITVLDDMHGMFTGHPDEKSQNAEEVNPASPAGGMLIQQRKDDPDHAVDTKFNVHVIDTKNYPVLKDKPGGGRRLLTTPE